ncbi:MAG: hypothetical protein KH828_05830 [Clostridiales bacterium]|nr:hypothetical protein [Clostridiales bacterium]
MKKRQLHRSSILLMELLIAVLFFSLAGTVCMRFFAKSYQLSSQADELSEAVNLVSSKAEEVVYGASEISDLLQPMYYGKDFNSCEQEEAVYELTTDMSADGSVYSYFIAFKKIETDEVIYSVTADTYVPPRDNRSNGGADYE